MNIDNEAPSVLEGAEYWKAKHDAAQEYIIELRKHLPPHGAVEALPATGPYVDRIVRIFRDRRADDTSALVLLDYARAAFAQPASQEGWRDMATAPKDGTPILAMPWWKDYTGNTDGHWGEVLEYIYEGEPNYWHCKARGTCIRPDYQDKYVYILKPTLPAAPSKGA